LNELNGRLFQGRPFGFLISLKAAEDSATNNALGKVCAFENVEFDWPDNRSQV